MILSAKTSWKHSRNWSLVCNLIYGLMAMENIERRAVDVVMITSEFNKIYRTNSEDRVALTNPIPVCF